MRVMMDGNSNPIGLDCGRGCENFGVFVVYRV